MIAVTIQDDVLGLLQAAYDGLTVKPGRRVVAPGQQVAWDDCCEGQLWVRTISATPDYARGAVNRCPVWTDVVYGVGVARCVHSLDDRGRTPSAAQVTEDGLATLRDMRDLHNVLQCYALPSAEITFLGEWTPTGPQGGCASGEWTLTARYTIPMR